MSVTIDPINGISEQAGALILGTPITLSGATVDIPVPSWARKIMVGFYNVSTNGTSNPCIRLGTSGGIVSSGYLGSATNLAGAAVWASTNSTTDFRILGVSANNIFHGIANFALLDPVNNVWVGTGCVGFDTSNYTLHFGGRVQLPGLLTTIQLTTVIGTQTFDSGLVNALFE